VKDLVSLASELDAVILPVALDKDQQSGGELTGNCTPCSILCPADAC
jgi:hypothetical protein